MNKGLVRALCVLLATTLCPPLVVGSPGVPEAPVTARYLLSKDGPAATTSPKIPSTGRQDYDAVAAYVWAIVPSALRPSLSELDFFVGDPEAEESTDGTASSDGVSWVLSLEFGQGQKAVVGKDRQALKDFDSVIAHELGHVISLAVDDETYRADSPINAFYQQFWKGRYPGYSPDLTDSAVAAGLYGDHPGDFVSQYAATDPSEDWAETFAAFVLGAKPTEGASSLKDRKLLSLYSSPELVADRDSMRRVLGSLR